VPVRALVDFARVGVAKGAKASLNFEFPADRLALTNSTGQRAVYPGKHTIEVSDGTTVVEVKVEL
jgi:hypothetical protein